MIELAILGVFLVVAVLQVATLAVLLRRQRAPFVPLSLPEDEADGAALGRHKHKYPKELVIPDPENGVAIHVCRCGARTPRRLGA